MAPMPFIDVRLTRSGITPEWTVRIVRALTATIPSVKGKRPKSVREVIDEISPEKWGDEGVLTSGHRKWQL